MADAKDAVGGIESPDWSQKVYENTSPQTSVRASYFRIRVADEGVDAPLMKGAAGPIRPLGQGTLLEHTNFIPIEKFVTKITVVETMEGPEQYEIEIVDPEMEIMFSEHLYVGRPLYIDMGYYQGAELIVKPIAKGHIHTMDFSFPEDGLPRLTLKGFGLVWDVLDKEKKQYTISFSSTSSDTKKPLHQRTYKNVTEMLKTVAQEFGLKIEEGKTVPYDLQKQVFYTGVPDAKVTWNPPEPMTWNGYLRWLARKMGCWYFVKGSFIHFYPAAWAQAPVRTRHEILLQKTELEEALKQTSDPEEKKGLQNSIKAKDEELKTVDAQFKDINMTGMFELNWRMGNKNMLSFSPVSTDINTSGYIAMAMNPDTGDISYGDSLTTGNNAGKINCMETVGKSNPKAIKGMDFSVKPIEGETEEDISNMMFIQSNPKFIGPLNKASVKKAINRKNIEPPLGPMDSKQAAGVTAASFRNWMWFQEAKATCIGDIRLTCGIPVWVRGLGSRSGVASKSGQYDSGKLCGKWYVFEVIHQFVPDGQYTCQLQLKRFWQYLNDFNKTEETNKEQLGATDPQTYIQSHGAGGSW